MEVTLWQLEVRQDIITVIHAYRLSLQRPSAFFSLHYLKGRNGGNYVTAGLV